MTGAAPTVVRDWSTGIVDAMLRADMPVHVDGLRPWFVDVVGSATDDHGWVDNWVVRLALAWDIAAHGGPKSAWWATFPRLLVWLQTRPDREDVARALWLLSSEVPEERIAEVFLDLLRASGFDPEGR